MNVKAFYNMSYGVYIVTTFDEDKNRYTGCVANSIMQITSQPATVAISINHDNYTHACLKKHGKLAVTIMGEKSPPTLIGTFGFFSGRDKDKLAGVPYTVRRGVAVPDNGCAYLICEIIGSMETATHTVFLAQVLDSDVLSDDVPMTYAYYHKVIKGTTAKNAPTYIPPEALEKGKAEHKCTVCGYVYDGYFAFDELPLGYKCPTCGAEKDKFTLQ